jgi:hypothetical protein
VTIEVTARWEVVGGGGFDGSIDDEKRRAVEKRTREEGHDYRIFL